MADQRTEVAWGISSPRFHSFDDLMKTNHSQKADDDPERHILSRHPNAHGEEPSSAD